MYERKRRNKVMAKQSRTPLQTLFAKKSRFPLRTLIYGIPVIILFALFSTIPYVVLFQAADEDTKTMKSRVKVKDTTSTALNGMIWYPINKSEVDEPKVKDVSNYENPEKENKWLRSRIKVEGSAFFPTSTAPDITLLIHEMLWYPIIQPVSLCGIESIIRSHASHFSNTENSSMPVKLIVWVMNTTSFEATNMQWLLDMDNILGSSYVDGKQNNSNIWVEVCCLEFNKIIAGTPFEQFYKTQYANLKAMRHMAQSQADAMRLVLIYKYGGLYLDTDVIIYGDLTKLVLQHAGLLTLQGSIFDLNNNFFYFKNVQSPLIYLLMENFIANYSPAWGQQGPALFSRVMKNLNGKGVADNVEIMDKNIINCVHYYQIWSLFGEDKSLVKNRCSGSVGQHFWSKESKQKETKLCLENEEEYIKSYGGSLRKNQCPSALLRIVDKQSQFYCSF